MPDISSYIHDLSVMIVPMLLAIVVHEVSHGFVAYLLGDPTAKLAGRLTLNPFRHLDLFGTLAFVLTRMIGWAKPVPINPRYFKNPRRGMMLVSLAGPGSNLLLAALSALMFPLLEIVAGRLDRQTVLMVLQPLAYMIQLSVMFNLSLALFNLLPIPPLDGSKIVAGLLPPETAWKFESMERWGFIVIIVLVMAGALQKIIDPVRLFLYELLMPGLG